MFFRVLILLADMLVLSGGMLWPVAPTRAQDDARPGPSFEAEAMAREALESGRRLMRQEDFAGAARALERAFRLAPPDSALASEADTDWHETLPRAMVLALLARGEYENALKLTDDVLSAATDHPHHHPVLEGLRSSVIALQKAATPSVDEKKYSRLAAQALDDFRRREGRYPAGIPETREALARAGVLAHYLIVDYLPIGAGYRLLLRSRNPVGGAIELRSTGLMQ